MTATLIAEWLRAPTSPAAGLAAGAAIGTIVALWPGWSWRRAALAAVLAGLAAEVTVTQLRLTAVERDWPAEREARIAAAGRRLGGDLHAAFHLAEQLAADGAQAATLRQGPAFDALSRTVPPGGVETGIAILDADGAPWAWAGRHRLAPVPAGDSIAARANGYYVVLETRRHSGGRVVVAQVLVWAHPAVPDRSRSLAELFRARTEVGLLAFEPGQAPDDRDVFDYVEPTTEGENLLFSVRPVPPEQAEVRERLSGRGGRAVTVLLLAALALCMAAAPTAFGRYAVLPVLVWLAARAPVGDALGVSRLFSSATFFHPLLGPFSASPAALALTGALLATAAAWFWRRADRRTPAGVVVALLLAAAAPFAVASFGTGIAPPAEGTPIRLWLVWQVMLVLAAAPLAVAAGALLCGGSGEPPRWRVAVGVALALAAGAVGMAVWDPVSGWPGWLPALWVAPLVLVAMPAPRWAAVAGMATVLGSLAALVTWSAQVEARIRMAERDIHRLGAEADPFAVPLLERFAASAADGPAPATPAELYALWRGSPLRRDGYPAQLALWSGDAPPAVELALDSLALPREAIGAVARAAPPAGPIVRAVPGVPGVHHIMALRLDSSRVLTVAIGPRSSLVVPSRLGRLLGSDSESEPLYRLALAASDGGAGTALLVWRRDGWNLRSERTVPMPGGPRDVLASIDLTGPFPLAVRGVLVLLLDIALLAVLWWMAGAVAGDRPDQPRWRRMLRSFRLRLAVALAAFFIAPTVMFAAWTFSHFGDEAERGRDILISQTLRDAAVGAGTLLRTPGAPLDVALRGLSERIDADLVLYRGGALVATSAPILRDLGVATPLMDPGAFRPLALGVEQEVSRDGVMPELAERVGYRVLEFGPPRGIGVLATPQVTRVADPESKQLELALVLLLSTLAGIAAAVAGAGLAARTLSRPVSDLRRSALALGQGRPTPILATVPPVEFEPVFGAFERMAADVIASRSALEEARRRTAAVLATVATGVVGLDPAGRVLIANRQARELLDADLAEGRAFADALPPAWAPLADTVTRFLKDPVNAADASELTVAGRRVTVRLAPLGPDVSGIVLALSDVSDLSRAERVLAWGEMARQVAHEIKNPLTPMRLGIQHLRRVHRDRRADFDRTLEETAERILAEIDRLDTIARAFSRFAAPADEALPLERVDLVAAAREVVQLYSLAGEGALVRLEADGPVLAAVRRDEVKEVLVNLLENARNAGARTVTVSVGPSEVTVADDGSGVPAALLPRIFEPRFSTNTSGSGLGLSIVRRLVEGWGWEVTVESAEGRGTTVAVRERPRPA